jgi:hypothetical protein
MKLKNSGYLIGSRTRDLPVCRIAPHPTTLLRAFHNNVVVVDDDDNNNNNNN